MSQLDVLTAQLRAMLAQLSDAQLASWLRAWFTPSKGPAGPDIIPPTDPAGLSASSVAAPVLTLTTLSTDNIAVTGYEVWRRAGGASAKIATTQGFPYTDSSAAPSTTYNYKVRAFDAAGNFSNFCTEAAATTPGGLAADTTAPLTPSAPTLITNGATSIVLALPLTTDSTVNQATQVVSGMKDYQVYVGGVAQGSPVPQPSQAISFAGAGQLIGAPAIVGSSSIVSGTYTVACGGNQWGGTAADQARVIAANVIGDFDISFRFVSNSGGQQFSRQFLCARAGFDPAAQFIDIECEQDATQGFNSQFRAVAGTNCGWNGALLPHALPYFGRIKRAGNTFTTYISSDGSTWGSALTTQIIAMPSVLQLCVGCSAYDGGTPPTLTFTSIFDTLSFTGQTVAQFTDTFQGSASPVARVYTQTGRDNALNVSAASASLSVTPTALTGATKWHPTHGVSCITLPSTPSSLGQDQAAMNDMDAAYQSPTKRFGYFQGEVTWYYCENAAGGTYDFSMIRNWISYLKGISTTRGVNYKLVIYVENEGYSPTASTPQAVASTFGGLNNSGNSIAPDYVINGLTGGAGPGVVNNDFGVATIALWRQNEMTAFIAFMTAMAQASDGQGNTLDASPWVEAVIPISETGIQLAHQATPGDPKFDSTYSAANYATQLTRLGTAMKQAWQQTNVCLMNNFQLTAGSSAQLATLSASWASAGCGMGGPDILYGTTSGAPSTGDQISRGVIGGVDYRGKVPLFWMNRANWGSWSQTQNSTGTESYEFGTLQATHVTWSDNGNLGPAGTHFSDSVAALQANNWRISSACPSNYNACNTS